MTGKVDYQKVHVLGENEVIDSSKPMLIMESQTEDEISLIDLYLVLEKHKKLMAMIIAAIFLLGLFYAISKPRVFNHSVSIQIGKMYTGDAQNNSLQPIEPVKMVLSKINEIYIPVVINEYTAENPDKSVPEIKARIPKNSDIIIVEAKASEKELLAQTLIQSVVNRVIENHRPHMNVMKSQFATELNNAQIKLMELESPTDLQVKLKQLEVNLLENNIKKKELTDPQLIKVKKQQYLTKAQSYENKLLQLQDKSRYMTTELKRLDQLDVLLEKQILGLSEDVNQALKNRTASADNIDNPSMAMTALLLNNQLQNDRRQMNELQERLYIKQKNLREKLTNDIRANDRAIEYNKTLIKDLQNSLAKLDIDTKNNLLKLNLTIAEKQAAIDKFKLTHQLQINRQQQIVKNISLKLNNLEATQALSEPLKSVNPVGTSKKLIVMVSLFLGIFIAVFVAFGREFLLKVQEKQLKPEFR